MLLSRRNTDLFPSRGQAAANPWVSPEYPGEFSFMWLLPFKANYGNRCSWVSEQVCLWLQREVYRLPSEVIWLTGRCKDDPECVGGLIEDRRGCQGRTREKSLLPSSVPAHPQSWFKAVLESSSHCSSHPFSPLFSPPFSSKWTCSPSRYLRISNASQFIKPVVLSPGCTLIFLGSFLKIWISGSW